MGRLGTAMVAFFAKRLLYLVLTMFVVSLLVYGLMEATPGDVARKVLGPFATQDQVDRMTVEQGWDRPVIVRYVEWRSEEHTSELQSLMRISYAVFCLKKKKKRQLIYLYEISMNNVVENAGRKIQT